MFSRLISVFKRRNTSRGKFKKIVTEKPMKVNTNGNYMVSINLVLIDNNVEVINQNISQNHNPANSILIAKNELIKKAQALIDSYKADKEIRKSSEFTNLVTYIDSSLEV